MKEQLLHAWQCNNDKNLLLLHHIGDEHLLVSHESHHRGNILLTLKQSGFTLPDKLRWGLWEWSK